MPLIRPASSEEQQIRRSEVGGKGLTFVVTGPDHRFRDAELPAQRFEAGPKGATPDDEQPVARNRGAQNRMNADRIFETATFIHLTDEPEERNLRTNAIVIAKAGARTELRLVDGRGCERDEPATERRGVGELEVAHAYSIRSREKPSSDRVPPQGAPRMKRAEESHPGQGAGSKTRQPVIMSQVSMDQLESLVLDQLTQPSSTPTDSPWGRIPLHHAMRERKRPELALKGRAWDESVVRVDPRGAKRLDFRECRRCRTRPTIEGYDMEKLHGSCPLHDKIIYILIC